MPIVKRKPVAPEPVPDALIAARNDGKDPAVYYLAATGEVFAEYDYYHQRIFQCELTGRSNLTYFEACHSEAVQTLEIQKRFPEPLKGPVLRAVQFQITGRIDNLVDSIFDRFRERFFVNESVFFERDNDRYFALVRGVRAPQDAGQPHSVGTCLSISAEDAAQRDPPGEYVYSVQLIDDSGQYSGDVVEARAASLSRDRVIFSKSILRRFFRDCIVRDAQLGSPWVVRERLAKRYGIPTEPTDEIAVKLESVKEEQLNKRRKLDPESAAKRKEREERKRAAEERKPGAETIKYPTEDTRLPPIDDSELATNAAGELPHQVGRPVVARADAAVGMSDSVLEAFLRMYYFLVSVGKALGLSPIAFDDLDAALRHPTHDPPCALLAEVHTALLQTVVRDGAHSKELAPAMIEAKQRQREQVAVPEAPIPDDASAISSDLDDLDESPERVVIDAAHDIGHQWERRALRIEDGRRGWETHVVGCLASRATPEAMPRMIGVLSHLTGIEHESGFIDGAFIGDHFRSASERYPHLPVSDKIEILLFLCELAVMTRAVHAYYDECEAHLAALRKERIEISRARKKAIEQKRASEGALQQSESAADASPAPAEEPAPESPSDASDSAGSESDSERDELASDSDSGASDGSERYRRTFGARQEALREKALQREADNARTEAERMRLKEEERERRELNAERRRLAEEAQRLARREVGIEREYRQYAQIPRLRPLGRDRFLDRYYWIDGVGAGQLMQGSSYSYQTGRIFVQAPSQAEWDELCSQYAGGEAALSKRRDAEEPDGALRCGEWGVYSEPEQIEQLIAWLRTKGVRENALKSQLLKYRDYIEGGMRRRMDDIALGFREPAMETRRSSRVRSEQSSQMRMPYMQWRNDLAK
ncbi:dolichyl-P-Glc:Glc1Man9GlcNAc2-PP-dolichol alpha-1,3-glucosyltransferase [Malassezia cuniculi]|uniref:Dolichyl-P-Glc:Glc1Man9GlcNAc2-PP-dolichol alpha-1,3-glucosyltransferase n=1 Tax=Malassezia cuniculi TaxID=948313 RepID=A0AAF0EYC2_9BASI|nr:dolichyl-P-Glc:Glc1Man9GlcNAc2-PP-dolichol alpha-1,3-glucosyltransferase [Malassezia cuniculi]